MKEIDGEKVTTYLVATALVVVLTPLLRKVRRSRGKNLIYHALFVAAAVALLLFLPEDIQDDVFSPGGVLVIGSIVPVYESIVAVCTPGEGDDRAWLQFWIASGTLSYCTEWIDDIKQRFPQGGEHWYEFEFFLTLWLLLPFTDGAALFFDKVTEPYIVPHARKLKGKAEGWIASAVVAAVNMSHLYFVWFAFMTLPEEVRRFCVVAVGTVYPLGASIVAVTTCNDGTDDTFWLTYWSCFSLLFLAMDYLENFVGGIRGFYSLCLAATVYLFLPMFGGADAVFRRVLVPLSGQYENMLLRDAYLVRRGMEASIPEKHHEKVFRRAAQIFGPVKDKEY